MKRIHRSLVLAVLFAGMGAPALLAQEPAQTEPAIPVGQTEAEDDAPGRGVARISLLNGDVSVRRGDSGDWIAAALNGPLMADDRVLTGPGASAEIQLNYYNRVRLAGDSEVRFPELEWHKYQIQVARGTIVFAALPGTNDQLEFATPVASLRPLAPGSYRVTVHGGGDVEFTVRGGEADIYTTHGSKKLTPGHTMRVHTAIDGVPEFQLTAELPNDAFDEFNIQRDQELSQVQSYQHMPKEIEGGEDLDRNGEWVQQEPYGYVWRPYVAPGWAPYQEGRWVWMDYYGWTWVSYDPWGWAPYHYGGWFSNAGAWYWYPGGFGCWWHPAMVGFFGWGGGGYGFGFYGWVPLAPHEHYHRWYGHGHDWHDGHGNPHPLPYNHVNVARSYHNAQAPNGVHGMSTTNFGRGAAGRGSVVPASQLTHASAMRGLVPVTPSHESLRMSDRQVSNMAINRGMETGNQHFIASRQAPAVNRVSFDQQRQNIAQAIRNPNNVGSVNRTAGPAAGTVAGAGNTPHTSSPAVTSPGGWPRVNAPSTTAATHAPSPAAAGTNTNASGRQTTNESRGGWSTFGSPGASTRNYSSAAESGTASTTGGWNSFGNPGRSATPSGYSTNANGNVKVYRGGQNAGATEAQPSAGWSSGNANTTHVYGGQAPSSTPAPATQHPGGNWSTGGGNNGRGASPSVGSGNNSGSYGPAPHSSAPSGGGSYASPAPHYSAPSGGGSAPHYSAPAAGAGGHASSGGSGGGGGHAGSGGGGGGHSGGGGGGHSGKR